MSAAPPASPRRAGLGRVFRSPTDGRLRAGWRLAMHALLAILLLIAFALPLSLILAGLAVAQLDVDLNAIATGAGVVASVPAITLATWLARRGLDRRSFFSLGLVFDRNTLLDLLVGFFIPAVMMGLVFLTEWSLGWLEFQAWAWVNGSCGGAVLGLVGGLALFIAVGYQEELLSRGYQLQNLVDGLNLPLGLFLSSAAFSVLHLLNPHASPASVLGILGAGYFLGYGWVRTRQLWLSIGLHIGWNFFEGTIFGFPVSGLHMFRLIEHTVGGPRLVTGGSFGPEAGLVILPALALGAALVHLYTRGRPVQR